MSTTTTSSSLREARRKRILERGSDRLALITGQIDSLPSSSSSAASESHHLRAFSAPPIRSSAVPDQPPPQQPPNLPDNSNDRNNLRDTELERCKTTDGSTKSVDTHASTMVEPQSHKNETDGTIPPPASTVNRELERLLAPSSLLQSNSAVADQGRSRESRPPTTSFFTVNKLGSSISASENIRFLCAVVIALLVVLSHLPIPLLRNDTIETVRSAGPVFLVLLTDITIVLARLLSSKGVTSEEETTGPAEGIFSLLEGLGAAVVSYKAITAAFMDCCVYLVVVVCGLSLLQLCI